MPRFPNSASAADLLFNLDEGLPSPGITASGRGDSILKCRNRRDAHDIDRTEARARQRPLGFSGGIELELPPCHAMRRVRLEAGVQYLIDKVVPTLPEDPG